MVYTPNVVKRRTFKLPTAVSRKEQELDIEIPELISMMSLVGVN